MLVNITLQTFFMLFSLTESESKWPVS